MTFFAIQVLNGLSYATTLFLMAAGLTLIFGVTRIVNFAHGSFFMLGALLSAHWVTNWFPAWGESAVLYALAMLIGAAAAALAGAVMEMLLLRRLYGVPELYQLVATFGLTLAMGDAMRWGFGPAEVFAPRFPGLKGSVELWGEYFPVWQLVTMVLGPLVWLGLHLLLTRTRFGQRLRAATMDRAMLDALGVNPKPLMLGAVVLGCALAGLGGALQLPREPANLQMDVNVIVETFVVVVTGGLGSISGAFFAALLIGLIHSLGVSLFPQATLVLVFLTMAVVLAVRPQGLMGQPLDAGPREIIQKFHVPSVRRSWNALYFVAIFGLCALALAVAAVFGAAVVRSSGVYLAMLSLALAQVIWATATQWVALTGGDNGVIGLRLVTEDTRPLFFGLLAGIGALSVAALGRLAGSTFGAALQAVRDAPQRAAASGLPVNWIKYRIFVESAVLAGLAGGLAAAHKGAVFPSAASVATSVDALLVVLLGGVHQLWGAAVGSAVLTWASAELGSSVAGLRDYWRGALGVFVMAIMVLSPSGLIGSLQRMKGARPAARQADGGA